MAANTTELGNRQNAPRIQTDAFPRVDNVRSREEVEGDEERQVLFKLDSAIQYGAGSTPLPILRFSFSFSNWSALDGEILNSVRLAV